VDRDVSALTGETATIKIKTEGDASVQLAFMRLKYQLPNRDTDDDGLIDRLEREGVDHGVTCSWEDGCGTQRTDNTNPYSADTDGDGLTDDREVGDFVSETFTVEMTPGDSDTGSRVIGDDNSTVRDITVRYFKLQSNPTKVDSDGDDLSDSYETRLKYEVVATTDLADSLDVLSENDTEEQAEEFDRWYTGKTDPLAADTDGDSLEDAKEVRLRTDARKADTDEDGIIDGQDSAASSGPTIFDIRPPTVTIRTSDQSFSVSREARGGVDVNNTVNITFKIEDPSGVEGWIVSENDNRYRSRNYSTPQENTGWTRVEVEVSEGQSLFNYFAGSDFTITGVDRHDNVRETDIGFGDAPSELLKKARYLSRVTEYSEEQIISLLAFHSGFTNPAGEAVRDIRDTLEFARYLIEDPDRVEEAWDKFQRVVSIAVLNPGLVGEQILEEIRYKQRRSNPYDEGTAENDTFADSW